MRNGNDIHKKNVLFIFECSKYDKNLMIIRSFKVEKVVNWRRIVLKKANKTQEGPSTKGLHQRSSCPIRLWLHAFHVLCMNLKHKVHVISHVSRQAQNKRLKDNNCKFYLNEKTQTQKAIVCLVRKEMPKTNWHPFNVWTSIA